MRRSAWLTSTLVVACASNEGARETRGAEIVFERVTLATEFSCEGACFADFDRDGDVDIAAGPWWYEGPSWTTRHALYAAQAFDPHHYSDAFFAWPSDVDRDGWIDVLAVGFPGKQAAWLRNPGRASAAHWELIAIANEVSNESPAFVDLTGDRRKELVAMSGGRFGWFEPDARDPRAPWEFHALSSDFALGPFVHGLGVGDIDGDGREDLVWKDGWFEQPPSRAAEREWEFHPFAFTDRHGGAQMLVLDVDADGDNDVVTSLAAHGYGLSWFEQTRASDAISFVEHRFLDDGDGAIGELHALDLADIDGDGDRDVVTGKRWWSHGPENDMEPKGGAPLVWFELARDVQGFRFVRHEIDDGVGVGVQLATGDLDGDGDGDVLSAGKRGVFALLQGRGAPAARAPTLDFETGDLRGWTAVGDAFVLQPVRGDTVTARGREASLHAGDGWIGGYERLGDGPRGTLTSNPFEVAQPWASFLLGGGASADTRAEILDANGERVLFTTSAANFESLQRVVVDLYAHVGQRIRVRLVDDDSGGWGHVNFDDFRFHADKPSFELPPGVPPITPLDAIANAGLAPADAARAMTVPPGFQVDLIAAEPDVHQPIALAIDDRGRLWIAEAFTYPTRAPEGQGRDDILVFEDADHDGSFEKRTVFASGLNLVSGLELGFGGVWVGAAPYLLFIPDRDGDLVPDAAPEILLDGWGYQDTHETLNSFIWGPDGWLYGCHGVFTDSLVGAPGTPNAERTPLNAGVWRFHPTRREFEVFAWGTSNPWGLDFDEHGQAFVTSCVIPHLFHLAQGGRYERQSGTHFEPYVFDDIKTIADHRHFVGSDPHGGNLRSNDLGGGHAHCGLLIYGGEQWPSEYRGGLYFENIHGNRINHDVVERVGSGFVGKHAPDLLLANDRWFRGISFKQGPDGSVYFIDWYDKQACHLTTPEVWDRTNGRVYRLRYQTLEPRAVDLRRASDQELADLSVDGDEWRSRHARRLLQERWKSNGSAVVPPDRTADGLQGERAEVRWVWLFGATHLDEAALRRLMEHPYASVRAWSVQFAVEDRVAEDETCARLVTLARSDPSPVVLLYVASALQRIPLESRWRIAWALAQRGDVAQDQNIPLMLWYGIEPLVAAEPERALAEFVGSPIETIRRFVVRRAAADPSLHPALFAELAKHEASDERAWMLEEVLKGVAERRGLNATKGWMYLQTQLAMDPDLTVRERAQRIALAFGDESSLPDLRRMVADPATELATRLQVLEALLIARDAETAPLLRDLFDDDALRGPAIRALAAFDDVLGARELLKRYAEFGVEDRRDALNTLSSRASYAAHLVDALETAHVPRTDLGAFVVRKIEALDNAELTRKLGDVWGRVNATPQAKKERIEQLKALLGVDAPADRAHGRALFAKTCQQCHTLFGAGGSVGPDLTGSNRSDLDYLLSNVVDPNAVVGKDYLATIVWTHDERLVTGIQKALTDSSITLASENETVTLARDEIASMRTSDLSTMPEGLLDGWSEQDIRDLAVYLRGATQAPLPASAADTARFFDGESLRGWSGDTRLWSVDDGEIVGRTSGLEHNAFLVSELELGDFRLSFEVRLAGDAGNSGVQFRSRARDDGDVEGLQADIGPGWWGKLYEEHGRGLLAQSGCEAAVIADAWNRYEIEARGSLVRTWINGIACVELDDTAFARRGQIALQLHSGGATEVRLRKLVLELLH